MGRNASTLTAVLSVATTVALSGCAVTLGNHSNSSPTVSKDALQKDISQRLSTAGQSAQSVTCQNDLVGQLGQITRCDVTMGPANSFEPIVTVTGLEGTKVDYDITPSVSKSQVEASVAQLVTNITKTTPDSVSCQSGVDGKVGAVAYCDVVTKGTTTRRTVEVSEVSGLSMKYGLIPLLTQPMLNESLALQLRQTGQNPESVSCANELEGKVGNTVECITVTAGQQQTYVLAVTAVHGESITFNYTLKS
ncbi:MAG: hypothetical protein QOC63_4843 [Mycobacterium sp.]|jgi:hypothetical protein|nr:hypothetical protein [Mycobacterium sp.]